MCVSQKYVYTSQYLKHSYMSKYLKHFSGKIIPKYFLYRISFFIGNNIHYNFKQNRKSVYGKVYYKILAK